MRILQLLIATSFFFTTVSCEQNGGTRTTEGGLEYRFIDNRKGTNAQMGDIVVMQAIGVVNNDTVLNSYLHGQPFYMMVAEPDYQGAIQELLPHLSEGDSVSAFLNADSLYMGQFPEGIQPGDMVNIYIKVERVYNESDWIDEYLQEKDITVERTESGIRVYFLEEGTGPRVNVGDTVTVHYVGKLLDGSQFDSSIERDEPFRVPVGEGRIITGWEEALLLLREGSHAVVIIPSAMAYGERGAPGVIPPFSPLQFEIHVLEVE